MRVEVHEVDRKKRTICGGRVIGKEPLRYSFLEGQPSGRLLVILENGQRVLTSPVMSVAVEKRGILDMLRDFF